MNEHIMQLSTFRGRTITRPIMCALDGRGYIGGSYAAWTVSPFPNTFRPNDIDVFMKTEEDAISFKDFMCAERKFYVSEVSGIAYTIEKAGHKKIQIIKPSPEFREFPQDVIESFDLDICRAVLVSPEECLADGSAGSMRGKVLRINNPLRTLKRILKYQQRGVQFYDHEILKVFQAWEATSADRKQAWIDTAFNETLPNDSGEWDYDEDEWWEGE